MHLQNFENFGNECAEIKNQFLIFRKSLCKIAGNPWKSILKSINQNAFFFSRVYHRSPQESQKTKKADLAPKTNSNPNF
jgi:hypothetical protein